MTPNEIYKLKIVNEGSVLDLIGYGNNHLPELTEYDLDSKECESLSKITRVKVRYIVDDCFEGRVWTLGTVWFDDIPVMIIQNAGREGDDHTARFITNPKIFIQMIIYLRPFIDPSQTVIIMESNPNPLFTPKLEETKVVFPDKNLDELTSFYGNCYEEFKDSKD